MKNYYLAYCRKSTKPDDRQAASLPRQIKEIETFAKKNKINILKSFKESGTGWLDSNRPIFDEMVSLAWSRDDIRGIIAFDSDRLGRNDHDLGRLKELIVRGQIENILTTQGETFDDNSIEYLGIKSIFGFGYSHKISKNVKASVKSRTENGIPPYSTLPPGYNWDRMADKGQKKPLETNDWPLMRKVFDLYMSGQFSVASLWKEVDKMGLKNNRGRIVSKTRLHQLLRDPFYTGHFRGSWQESRSSGVLQANANRGRV